MDYKVLYRIYRPSNFDELIGQDNIVRILKNSIINNKIAHAYIFTGPRGTGKTSTAKIFARALNCPNSKNGIPCGECDNCLNFDTSPDIIELDAASNNGVDYIREIRDNVLIAPAFSKYKIYIIDEVHMLSNSAWNAFLKTLEEPPQNVIFILATTEIQKVPITVLSRCQRFDFNRIDRVLIQKKLKEVCKLENIKYKDDAIEEISFLSEGCMRDALSILDQLSKVSDNITLDILKENYGTVSDTEVDKLYTALIKNELDELIGIINDVKESGVDIKIFINKIIENFISKAVDIKKKNLSSTAFNQIKSVISVLNELLTNINSTTNGYLLLQLDLISFINSDENKLSTREIDQIVSEDIITSSSKVDLNTMIDNKSYYNVTDEFINIRVNNSFVNASKEHKKEFIDNWNGFSNYVKDEKVKELIPIIRDSEPMVVSDKNVLFVTKRSAAKAVNNSKLDILENRFNNKYDLSYKMIFISKDDWDKFMKSYDKDKEYEYKDDSKFINDNGSQGLAEDLFGDSVNIE